MVRQAEFLIIGAQKCGTSWLHRHLRNHPEIFMPAQKDDAFHCFRATAGDPEYRAAYERRFAAVAGEGRLVGDASAAYFWTRSGNAWDAKPPGYELDIPGRVRDDLGPALKLILALRNPVERVISAFFHHVADGTLSPHVSPMDAGAHKGLFEMGFYSLHLANWLRCYPLEAFHFLVLESDIKQAPGDALAGAFGFLGVDPAYRPALVEVPVFSGTPKFWRDGGLYVRAPGGGSRCVLSAKEVATLYEMYASDVRTLSEITGKDLERVWDFRR